MNVQRDSGTVIRRISDKIKLVSTGTCDCAISRIYIAWAISGAVTGITGAGGCEAPDCLDCPCCERTITGSWAFEYIKHDDPLPPFTDTTGYFSDCCSMGGVAEMPYDSGGSPYGTVCQHRYLMAPCDPDPQLEDRATPGQGAQFFEVFWGLSIANGVAIDANYKVVCNRHNLSDDSYSVPDVTCASTPTINGSFLDNSGEVDRLSDLIGSYHFEKSDSGTYLACASWNYTFTVDIDVS